MMSLPMQPSFFHPGPACRRSRLPGWLRLAITFGVLFTLKYTLPLLGVGAAMQILVLVVVVTVFAWQFWWNCIPDRRGIAVLIGTLWIASLFKLFRL